VYSEMLWQASGLDAFDPGGDFVGQEFFAAAGDVAAPVMAMVGQIGRPGELMQLFGIECAVFGSDLLGNAEADAATGFGEFAVGGAEEPRAPV